MALRKMFFLLALLSFGSFVHAQVRNDAGADLPLQWGKQNAKFQIEVFVDLQCPTCASYNEILKSLEKKYSDQILLTIRHYPLPQHDKALLAAKMVEAAYRQHKGFEMLDMILANQKAWTTDEKAQEIFFGYAKKLGLKMEQFKQDFSSEQTDLRIRQDVSRAKSLELTATPSVLLDHKLLTYAEDLDIEALITKTN